MAVDRPRATGRPNPARVARRGSSPHRRPSGDPPRRDGSAADRVRGTRTRPLTGPPAALHQTGANTDYASAAIRRVTAENGIEYGHRELGAGEVPLVLLQEVGADPCDLRNPPPDTKRLRPCHRPRARSRPRDGRARGRANRA